MEGDLNYPQYKMWKNSWKRRLLVVMAQIPEPA